jgi:hypothetical protein
MPETSGTSNLIASILAMRDGEPAVVWGVGPVSEWTADDPAEQIRDALRVVQTRNALDRATAKDGVKPLVLVFDAATLAAATATRESRAQLGELAAMGPAVDVHPVLARHPDHVHGTDFAVLLRVLGDLNEGIDMGPEDFAQADESYVAALFSLLRPRLDDVSAAALGPDYVAAPDAPLNKVTEAAREVVRAADGVWNAGVVRRWKKLWDRRPSGQEPPAVLIIEEEAGQFFQGPPGSGEHDVAGASSSRAELLARLMSQPGTQVQVFDPKDGMSPLQKWAPWARSEESGDEVLAELRAELLRRGHTDLELIEVDDVLTAKRMLGLDTGRPWHAVRVHFPGDRLVDAHEIEEAIRGRDQDEALVNARWNWPSADRVDYLGHRYEVGDPVVDAVDPDRPGRVVSVLEGAAIEDGPRLFVRFADADQDEEVSRDRIRYTGPDPAQDAR